MFLGIRWGSLRNKIIAWSFVPTAIILAAVAWVTFSAYQQVTEDLVIVRNQELARYSAGELSVRLSEYTTLLAEYAGLLSGLPAEAYADPTDLVIQRDVLQRARGRFQVFDGGVIVISNQGTVAATEPERPVILGTSWSDRAYFREMLRSPDPVFSDIVADGPGGAEVVVLSVPIKGDRGQFLGLLAGMFRLGPNVGNPLYTAISRLRIGEAGRAFLVDGTGRAIYHSDPQRTGSDLSAQPVAGQVLSGAVGAQRTEDLEGRDIVASYAPVPDTGWSLVAEESWASLTTATRGYGTFLVALLVLGLLVPAAVMAFGIRRITQPITQLISAAQEVASGDFDQTITAETGDEIEELAEQFNRMAAQVRSSYAQLEQRVQDRTRELGALNDLVGTVSQSLQLEEILEDALNKTLELMDIEAGGIYLLDRAGQLLTIAAHRGFSSDFIKEIDRLRVGEGFSGQVARTGEPLVVRDVSVDPRLTREVVKEEGLRSMVSVPLSSKGKVLGTLFGITRAYRDIGDSDVELLTSIGRQIGVALENAALYEDTRQRLEQLTALQETTKAVASTLDLSSLLDLIVQQASDLLEAEGGILNLVDWETGEDEVVACTGSGLAVTGHRLPLGTSLSGWVTLHNQPTISNDLPSDQRVHREGHQLVADMTGREPRNAAVAPLTVKDKVVGTLALLDKQGGRAPFDHADLDLLVAFATQAATAIENARLFDSESQRRQEASLLAEMARLIASTLDLSEVLRLTAQYAVEAFDVQCCCILMVDEARGTLSPAVAVGLDDWVAARELASEAMQNGCERNYTPSQRLWHTVFESLQPLILEDVPSDPHLLPGDELPFQSVLVVPMEVGGHRLGALQLATRPPHHRLFTDEEGELAMAMANQAAVALENVRLFDAEQRRAEQFRLVAEVGRRAASILAIDELLEQMVRLVQEAFQYDVVEFGLVEGDDLVFRAGVQRGFTKPFRSFRMRIGQEGITGWVASTGQPARVDDVLEDPRFVAVSDRGARSELAVPIQAKGRVIGVMNLQSRQVGHFDESDQALMMALADQAAIAIENTRLFDAEQRRAEQFRVVSEVGRHIASILDIEQLLRQIVQLVHKAFEYDHVGIALIEGDEAVYKVGAGRLGSDPHFLFDPGRLKVGEQGVTGWVAARGEPLLIPDVTRDDRYVWMRGSDTRSELAVPIVAKDQVIGVLDVQSDRLNAFDDSDLSVLQSLANQAAIAIENAQLYERAQRLAVLEERGRLARELHDAVTQTLFSASLIAETLPVIWESDQDEGRELLHELQQLSRGAMAEMRTLLLELRPAALAEANLGDLLRQLGEAVTGRTGLPVAVRIEGSCHCPPEVHIALYRIAQEALNNVVKHARPNKITVELLCTDAHGHEPAGLKLRVADDGRGFQASDVEPGELGLGIMRERAQSIGATLNIESKLGEGTQIRVAWPADTRTQSPATDPRGNLRL